MSEEFSLTISHTTRYTFSAPVYLDFHTLFFRPAPSPYYILEDHYLKINPKPEGIFPFLGVEGHLGYNSWFSGTHSSLKIHAFSRLRILPHNPFGFLIYPHQFSYFPFHYPKEMGEILSGYLTQEEPIGIELKQYAALIISQTDPVLDNQRDTLSLLRKSTQFLYQDFSLVKRESGDPQKAEKTYADRRGSCRDLTHLQICLFRHWGIAARFVSGYLYLEIPDQKPEFELHAWVEVFLPGAGWIGLDPSHGIFTDCHYIPVTRSMRHRETLPVVGFYRGEAKSKLVSDLKMEKG